MTFYKEGKDPPKDFSLIQFISARYRALSCGDPFRRNIISDITEVIQLCISSSSQPIKTLQRIGIILIQTKIIGINRINLSKYLFYTSDAVSRTLVRHKWKKLELQYIISIFSLKNIHHLSRWAFFEIPDTNSLLLKVLQNNCDKIIYTEEMFQEPQQQANSLTISHLLHYFITPKQELIQEANLISNHVH